MHEIPTQGRRHSAKDVFQIHPPISVLNLSNNVSVPQVRVNIREIERDTTFGEYDTVILIMLHLKVLHDTASQHSHINFSEAVIMS